MTEWRTVRIGETGRVVTGRTPPGKNQEWFGDLVPFITPSDIDGNSRRAAPGRALSKEGRRGLARIAIPADSVCFVCIGATIGKLCLTTEESCTNQQINTVCPYDDFDGRFLYYLLRHEASEIAALAGGAATPIINKTTFSNVLLYVPDKPTQVSISSVLGAIDDLIEINRRRVEVLDEMARAVYREWFVHFRFPGHEDATFVDSDLGPIPEGWRTSTCGAELNYVGGGTPSKKEAAYWEEGTVDWFTPSDLTRTHLRYPTKSELRITLPPAC